MKIRLERFAYLPNGTLGRLFLPDGTVLYTVERPWLDNKVGESCIPEGEYFCEPFDGNKFKGVFQITDVPNRSYILFHAANYPSQLQGCVAPGLTLMPSHSKEPGSTKQSIGYGSA